MSRESVPEDCHNSSSDQRQRVGYTVVRVWGAGRSSRQYYDELMERVKRNNRGASTNDELMNDHSETD